MGDIVFSVFRLLQTTVDGNAAATGITFSYNDDDDGTNPFNGTSMDEDDDEDYSSTAKTALAWLAAILLVLMCVVVVLVCFIIPAGYAVCAYWNRHGNSVELAANHHELPVLDDADSMAAARLRADKAVAERLAKLKVLLGKSELQTVITVKHLKAHEYDEERAGIEFDEANEQPHVAGSEGDAGFTGNNTMPDPGMELSTTPTHCQQHVLENESSSRSLEGRTISVTPTRTVPNVCAICLNDYQLGETVVWSGNLSCTHAFHQECMLDWLVKILGGAALCPCCRQEFVDMK